MLFWKTIFWISCFIVFYNYAGYAIIILLITRLRNKKYFNRPTNYYPSISFIVAAYNEEDCIETKIINSLEQNYPADKIEFIFITDGSTDLTPDIIRRYSSVKLLHSNERKGKSAALNRAAENAKNEILIFSDANTRLNKEASLNISQHYFDKSVGGVAGEKKVISVDDDNSNATSSEGFYWKYESYLKKLDSDFYSVVGAAGELFSVRKHLYHPVAAEVILDDFIISMKIAQQGFRIIYEPNAFAMELPSFSMHEEKKRKIRIAAGGFQSIAMLPEALLFWNHAKLTFLYVSHRVLRWTLSPLSLVLALLSSFILTIFQSRFYFLAFLLQFMFYMAAILYASFPAIGKKISILKLPYYFSFMNISVFEGFLKFIQKKQSSAWDKAKRRNYTLPGEKTTVS